MSLDHRPVLLLRNGSFYTMNPSQPRADAVAVDRTSGRILAVGDDAEVRLLAGPLADSLNLQGHTVLPGFIDAHVHLVHYAQSRLDVNLRGVESLEAAVELVRQRAARTPTGHWILGQGWDKNLWASNRFPSRTALDVAVPSHPVALWEHAHHAMWVNSEALRRAAIDAETPEPASGAIGREADGTPSGMLFEYGATDLVNAIVPPIEERLRETELHSVLDELLQRGITGVHNIEDDESLRLLQRLHSAGLLPIRVLLYLHNRSLPQALQLGLEAGFGDDYLRFAGIKLFLDGALGPQTAAMLDPYENQPGNRGILTIPEQEVARLVAAATEGGLGIAIHTIGDRAVHTALDAIESTLRQNAGSSEKRAGTVRRIRLEHVQLAAPQDIERMARLGIVASVQPFHAVVDRDVAERHWGRRHRRAYPYQTLRKSGVPLALGSDLPVDTSDPLRILHAAVTRRNDQEAGRSAWVPEQALTVPEALWAYTMGAAYAGGQEMHQGSLEPGKLADMVVLGEDPYAVPASRLAEVPVIATIVGGHLRYGRLE
ncbi:MAG: amidohydrolase [Ktedonobacterales bacterium]